MADQIIPAIAPKGGRKAGKVKPIVADTAIAAVEAAKADPAPLPEIVASVSEEAVSPQAAPVGQAASEQPAAVAEAAAKQVSVPVINTAFSGANVMNETIQKTQEATQQAAQQATEQFRGAMTDANQRGKAAIEKSARFAEEIADLTRGNLEAMVASQKTAAKYVETLAQGAADYNRRSFEEASATMRSFAEVKSPTDFFRLQSDYARSAFDSLVAESARVSETVVKMGGDVAQPIANRYSVAAERLKATVAA